MKKIFQIMALIILGSFLFTISTNSDSEDFSGNIMQSGSGIINYNEDTNYNIASTSNVNTDGLVAEYLFNGNSNDTGPNLVNGVVNGATLIQGRDGTQNSAYYFNGINNYINLGQHPGIKDNYSFSIWVKPETLSTQVLLVTNGSTINSQFYLTSGGKTYLGYRTGASNLLLSTGSYEVGKWNHLVATRENGKAKIFINGKLNVEGSVSMQNNFENWILGAQQVYNQYYFKGTIDDLKIYARALTESEILNLYNYNSITPPSNQPKITTFQFAGLTITVTETTAMYKTEVNIGGFKIYFGIEKV